MKKAELRMPMTRQPHPSRSHYHCCFTRISKAWVISYTMPDTMPSKSQLMLTSDSQSPVGSIFLGSSQRFCFTSPPNNATNPAFFQCHDLPQASRPAPLHLLSAQRHMKRLPSAKAPPMLPRRIFRSTSSTDSDEAGQRGG